jgi:hypothetical protein
VVDAFSTDDKRPAGDLVKEEARDSNADTVAGATAIVASPDVDDADRRAKNSLVAALLLAFLLTLAGFASANGVQDMTAADADDGSPDDGSGSPAACPVSDEVDAALAAAETPWDYMLVLGYPEAAINTVLNEQAESAMDEHTNGEVRWDPEANDGIYSDDAQLVLIMGADGETVEVTATQKVMELLGIDACTPGSGDIVLPAVS